MLHQIWLKMTALLAGPLLLSTGCSAEDQAPDYRYRLTVEVETPEGLKTGSSVIEVQQTVMRPGSAPGNLGVSRKVRGEAVAVDLPRNQTLFTLLRSESNVDWASYLYVYLKPPSTDKEFVDRLDDVLEVTGERELPRMWPPVGHIGERPAYPMLVTFSDIDDPTKVVRVDPDDLSASFGEGVSLKRITVALTDDPVTTGIEERLSWLREIWPNKLNGDRFEDMTTTEPSAKLSANSFSTEIGG
ncbi:hypothetical protein INR77_03015 [Erythrobacter sp. SCSIO 43205]|uniref:hypothetical protein n=1 Tax=Erythrobacter sp. SCSIO 43205 TaxID=2779361 RepID=UPI001CA88A5C|nr:hypothetical protein [Erythrobacter sp. SCSIO 43205]UAB78713.1 hypothetical protein INR77_03015 [Erythrobacter sp. SCSIO 43205]